MEKRPTPSNSPLHQLDLTINHCSRSLRRTLRAADKALFAGTPPLTELLPAASSKAKSAEAAASQQLQFALVTHAAGPAWQEVHLRFVCLREAVEIRAIAAAAYAQIPGPKRKPVYNDNAGREGDNDSDPDSGEYGVLLSPAERARRINEILGVPPQDESPPSPQPDFASFNPFQEPAANAIGGEPVSEPEPETAPAPPAIAELVEAPAAPAPAVKRRYPELSDADQPPDWFHGPLKIDPNLPPEEIAGLKQQNANRQSMWVNHLARRRAREAEEAAHREAKAAASAAAHREPPRPHISQPGDDPNWRWDYGGFGVRR